MALERHSLASISYSILVRSKESYILDCNFIDFEGSIGNKNYFSITGPFTDIVEANAACANRVRGAILIEPQSQAELDLAITLQTNFILGISNPSGTT